MTAPSSPMDMPPFRLQPLISNITGLIDDEPILSGHSNALNTDLPSPVSPRRPKSQPSKVQVRCAKALAGEIYVGCSDGTLIRCSLRNDGPSSGDAYSVVSRQKTPAQKPVDEIALAPSVSKALVLSGGSIYFYTLPALELIPSTLIQPLRGVLTFTLDDADTRKDQYIAKPPPPTGPASWTGSASRSAGESVGVCVIQERAITLYNLRERLASAKEIPLPPKTIHTTARRSGAYLCVADANFYSMIDMNIPELTPLIPVSQSPDEPDAENPIKPLIAIIGNEEFIVGSSIGTSTMGPIVNGNAEPTRAPLEWPAHPLAFSVEYPHIAALLPDQTIEIRSLESGLVVQTLSTPRAFLNLEPVDLSSNPGTLVVPSTQRNQLLRLVTVPLLASSPGKTRPIGSVPLTTPKKPGHRSAPSTSDALLRSRTLIIGSNGLQALVPSTFLSQAEALLDSSRIDDVAKLVAVNGGQVSNEEQRAELRYIYWRLALKCLAETRFEDAGEHFYTSQGDPRVLIRLFPDLRGSLISHDDTIRVSAGVEAQFTALTTIDEIVRNYSPHLDPESAPSTSELRTLLHDSSRVMLMQYLRRIRDTRPAGVDQDVREDKAVHTVLAKLLAQTEQTMELHAMLDVLAESIVIEEVEPEFIRNSQYQALVKMYRRVNNEGKLLEVWSKVAEGEWADEAIVNPIRDIIETLSTCKDRQLVQKYGVWLAEREPSAAFTLFVTPQDGKRVGLRPDDMSILQAFRTSDPTTADRLLEHLVLIRRHNDPGLHNELVTKYLDRLIEELENPATLQAFASSASAYSSMESAISFLVYLATTNSPLDITMVRLKVILFLQGSQLYDIGAARSRLEKRRNILAFESAILDGKLGNDRSALGILVQLHDSVSAEAYCTLGGTVIPVKTAHLVAESAGLQSWASLIINPSRDVQPKVVDEKRKRDLLRILMEVYMEGSAMAMSRTAELLNSQAVNLDVVDVLTSVPPTWSLNVIPSFLTRSFRRSQHEQHEGQILKAISWGQNLKVSDQAFEFIRAEGGVIEESNDDETDDVDVVQGEPSSFVEKVGLDSLQPVVGSVDSIHLRARKEGFVEEEDDDGLI